MCTRPIIGVSRINAWYSISISYRRSRRAITNNGNVGIGPTSPGAKLDVNGSIIVSSTGKDMAVVNQTVPGITHVGSDAVAVVLADNQSMTFTISFGSVLELADSNGRSAVFFASYDSATIVEIADPSGYYEVTNVDAAHWALWKTATSNVINLKNYINTTKGMNINSLGVITAATNPE